ncbi:MAG: FAD:protein FMN transferase [Firmicutes bacterium]|nr:FAD:protein FMN transferase [Bacillota bacterium]
MSRVDDERRATPAKRCALQQKRGLLTALAVVVLAAAVFAAAVFSGGRGGAGGKQYSYTELLMDTDIELQLFSRSSGKSRRVAQDLFAEMRRLELLLSSSDPDSEVSAINDAAGKEPVAVSPETAAVIGEALTYSALSSGAFDPTIAPLLERWGFREGDCRIPDPVELQEARAAVDYRLVEAEAGEIFLPCSGMALDLGGIAKGYIVDRGLDLLAQSGIEHALINAGGDVGILGPKADGTPWRVGIKHPRSGGVIAVIPWGDRGAIVTSGDYERFFEEDGVRYHHILDPRTGRPASALLSVTVVAPTTMEADALSTALFVLGPQRGLALVESLPGVEAVLITPQLELLISSGLGDLLERTGE